MTAAVQTSRAPDQGQAIGQYDQFLRIFSICPLSSNIQIPIDTTIFGSPCRPTEEFSGFHSHFHVIIGQFPITVGLF
jgi:hypothetical protein